MMETRMVPLMIDTSEQAPWRFTCFTERVNLPTGDYSLKGFESVLCVERKSIPDLVKTVIGDWQRFSRQLKRMAEMDVAFIVVEGSPSDLLEHKYTGDTNPLSVRGRLNRILLKYGVHTMFLENREIAAAWVQNLFQQYLEDKGVTLSLTT